MTQFCTAFRGVRRLASGPFPDVALAVIQSQLTGAPEPLLIFDDSTGKVVDFDPRKIPLAGSAPPLDAPRPVGRPRLGVVAREVTLLPRHWDWLNGQPGGASVALRKLVEQARRDSGAADRHRAARDAAYRFMQAMAGDFAGYEEALRALYADDRRGFAEHVAAWPPDIRDHAVKLAFADLQKEK